MKNSQNSYKDLIGNRCWLLVLMATALILLAGIATPGALADDDDEIPFDVANIYVELNNTDGDLGLHALIDGDGWKRLTIEDPRDRKMLDVRVKNRLRRQGLTELFFESAEPTFDELTPEQFFRRFPEGIYEIEGKTIEGEELESTALLTHVMPAPANGVKVNEEAAGNDKVDCEDDATIPSVNYPVIISWDPVVLSHPDIGITGVEIEVSKYQLVVEWEDDDENVWIFSIDLPASDDRLSVTVPSEFIDQNDEFKFEIITREESGNQTAVETCFKVQ